MVVNLINKLMKTKTKEIIKYNEDNWVEAPRNKFEGYWNGVPVYSNPLIEEGFMWLINEDNFDFGHNNKLKLVKLQKK